MGAKVLLYGNGWFKNERGDSNSRMRVAFTRMGGLVFGIRRKRTSGDGWDSSVE